MDPLTALANFGTAFFTFASTPAGQAFVTQAIALNQTIVQDVSQIVHSISEKIGK